jgi:hypothetical protein
MPTLKPSPFFDRLKLRTFSPAAIDLAHKRRILGKTIAINAKPLIFHPGDELMRFLQAL